MSECNYNALIIKLNKVKNSELPTGAVENVIIDLLKKNDLGEAISLVKKINPSSKFISVLAHELIFTYADYYLHDKDFILFKEIIKEDITSEEADCILEKYTGPNGKYSNSFRNIPNEILAAASRDALILFFKFVLEDKAVGAIDGVRKIWHYLGKKV